MPNPDVHVHYRDPSGRVAPGSQQSSSEVGAMRERLREQDEYIKKLKEDARAIGTVVELRGDHMIVSMGLAGPVDVNRFKGAAVGDRVLLQRNTMQATEVVKDELATGTIVTVTRSTDKVVEAQVNNELKAFRCPPGWKIRKGERVIVDPGWQYVIGTLGMPPASFSRAPSVSVEWSDVGGQEEAKEQLREAIELPLAHPELFAAYGKRSVKGVLLWGPSGTGKTLIAKAAATGIARAHGKKASDGFVYVKGPELLNAYIGKSEEAIRALFAAARDHKAEHGYPAVVFIDECDALLGARDRGVNVSLNATIVPQFLAEMDGLDDHAAMFILATNRPDMLDPAVVREGRIDRKVKVDRPTRKDCGKIFEIHLRGRPLVGDDHAGRSITEIFSDKRVIRELGEGVALRLRDFVSGAMIAGIVEQASTAAITRDICAGVSKPSGISVEDLVWSVGKAETALLGTNHDSAVRELLETMQAAKSVG